MTDKRQKATKVKCKREESLTKQSMFVEYSLLSEDKAFEFCWRLLADEHNSSPKSTRRHIKLDKFIFGTPWLPDLLCKHWFVSSVWNFCRWVADVPPRETSLAAKRNRCFRTLQTFLCGHWFWNWDSQEQIQQVARTGLKPRAAGLWVRCADQQPHCRPSFTCAPLMLCTYGSH